MSWTDLKKLKAHLCSPHGGLNEIQFLGMVGECKGCDRMMWVRTKDFHRCPGKGVRGMMAPMKEIFSRLDCCTGGLGITELQYDNLFASCTKCGLVFLRSAASRHRHSN